MLWEGEEEKERTTCHWPSPGHPVSNDKESTSEYRNSRRRSLLSKYMCPTGRLGYSRVCYGGGIFLEVHDGVPSGKYTVGLGQEAMAVVLDNEDVNSICLTGKAYPLTHLIV